MKSVDKINKNINILMVFTGVIMFLVFMIAVITLDIEKEKKSIVINIKDPTKCNLKDNFELLTDRRNIDNFCNEMGGQYGYVSLGTTMAPYGKCNINGMWFDINIDEYLGWLEKWNQ